MTYILGRREYVFIWYLGIFLHSFESLIKLEMFDLEKFKANLEQKDNDRVGVKWVRQNSNVLST